VSIDADGLQVQAFALEALIYTTPTLTTIFVSKADSTGYLHLSGMPKGTPSPIKTTIVQFLEYLVNTRWRAGVRLVISLFARAQNQYLFPGSIENSGKHVLDDRGLIRWWCQILDTVLQQYPHQQGSCPASEATSIKNSEASPLVSRGHLIVPGCDTYETRAFLPKPRPGQPTRWETTDPLRELGKPFNLPERCLIPRFPDDPKARFVIDLDDELPENRTSIQESPVKPGQEGKWRSVKSLAQFWEMMAFRQECAAGRVVGFLWGVLTPVELVGRPFETQIDEREKEDEKDDAEDADRLSHPSNIAEPDHALPTPLKSQIQDSADSLSSPPRTYSPPPQDKPLPPISSPPTNQSNTDLLSERHAANTDTYIPITPDASAEASLAINRELILSAPAYSRCITLFDSLDYAELSLAANSTRSFINAVAREAHIDTWGAVVVGAKEISAVAPTNGAANGTSAGEVKVLGTGLVRKKKRKGGDGKTNEEESAGPMETVNVLTAGLVRKKPRVSVTAT
jgi:regulator of Ty1 transposition protein 109